LRLLTAYSEQWKKERIAYLKNSYADKVRRFALDLDMIKKLMAGDIKRMNAAHKRALEVSVPRLVSFQPLRGAPSKLVVEFAYATFRAATDFAIDDEYVEKTWKALLREKRRLGELEEWLKDK